MALRGPGEEEQMKGARRQKKTEPVPPWMAEEVRRQPSGGKKG